jgi:deoxyribose-phosphate aldolase
MGEGATEIDAVVPLSRVLSGDFEAATDFALSLNESVTSRRGILKLIFETGLIADTAAKIQLCEICKQAGVAFVKTSTGFATEKRSDGSLQTLGATPADVRLLVEHAVPICRVKASGGIRTRAEAIGFLELGASRIGTGATAEILSAVE